MEQINTQYWAASFLNWWEAWSNWRRSGYPVLTPNAYPGGDPAVLLPPIGTGSDGFIHRMVYPNSEFSYNKDNVDAAAVSIGGDDLGNRIFWDVEP